ncbi:SgcJ/EcaC family oxidoreductase [Szabonella alba]|uniref:SgcJ/EcaC family oxidoreductase n=1 Tax=Szabonella alba TaxID=2804194 RepID=A0A8K0VEH4_9RHOB|nr:SgcJ/EcaC family oxidoreductase [Szabonella alba]MBL4918194.1 SgcJ/EcaC family oxidoreductase [Szabonella alba]
MMTDPATFLRAFAVAWGARDTEALAALIAADGDFLSLTGAHAEGRAEIKALFAAELSGTFSQSRLVTGKTRLRPLGDGAAVLVQRFVLSGLVDAEGHDLGRIGALMVATLVQGPEGWQAITLQFTATEG